ncbi:dephospho-CoA kinase [Aliiglaciecola lipolytica]|uniref:Dephospho-CoA kinase n=1 Tax=Aliiglaciecola lipolytica E3 TaxID=1127673 RepID=K6Y4H9_9ALTE|nr:dephospho-CoA kinase [Aliiglaciecola lipolytica]GAC13167.1 dephospho-CoA kinase [Aliiglaciecola lipolytica E3]
MSQFVIGLTGGIGSGKTAVSNMFAELGIDIIDADIVARQVVEPDSPALHLIEQKFGSESLLADGNLNRQHLRQIVFTDPAKKTWLDNLLHPLIRERMIHQLQQATSAYCILAVPLLIENNMMAMVNRVLVVDVSEDIQLQRAANRDQQSIKQIQSIMANQSNRENRINHADDIINNDGSFESLKTQVEKLHQRYLTLSKQPTILG